MDWDFSVGYLLRLEDLGSGQRVLGFRGRSRITTLALRTVRMVAPAESGIFAPASLKDCGVASKIFFYQQYVQNNIDSWNIVVCAF